MHHKAHLAVGLCFERLFNQILSNETHTLNNLLPPLSAASQHYNFRQRRHNLELLIKLFIWHTITSFSECCIYIHIDIRL